MVPPGGAIAPGQPAAPAAPAAEPTAEDVIRREAKQKEEKAGIESETAARVAEEQKRHEIDRQADLLEAKERQQAAQDELQKRIAEFDKNRELRDPRASMTKMDKVRSALAIAFGAFGAGLSAAGGHPTGNLGLAAVEKRLQDETERQKFNIARQSDAIVRARAGVADADLARKMLEQDEDARHASRLNEITSYGISRLKAKGMDDAQIEGDSRIVELRAAQKRAHDAAAASAAKNALLEAQAEAAKARAAKDNRKAKGGGVGSGGGRKSTVAERRLALSEQHAADQAAEKQDERTVRDVDGNPIGLAPTPRQVTQLTDKIAAVDSYRQKVEALARHIEEHGHILNPLSVEAKERASLAADVQSQGRQISGIQASDAGQKLEHEMIGGSGVALERTANPKVLRELAERAGSLVTAKLKSTLSPLPGQSRIKAGGETSPPPYRGDERAALGASAPQKARALPPGAVPAIKNGRRGIILNGAFHAEQ
jgi:hypothetical protein